MKKVKIPYIGYRNIKTALAVLICLLLLNKSVMASIAAIICMQSTIEDSVKTGMNRLIGTLIGGILGVIILFLVSTFSLEKYSIITASLSVSLIIYICNLIKKPAACVISSIVVLGIVIEPSIDNQIVYALTRTIETSIGVIVAILVNKFVNPPVKKNNNLNVNIEELKEQTEVKPITTDDDLKQK